MTFLRKIGAGLNQIAVVLKKIAGVDQTPSWRLFVIITIVLGLAFAAYDHMKDTEPKVVFEVITNTAVVDIKADLPSLGVVFDGTNIRQQGQSLQIITVKVSNSSAVDVFKDRYDPKDPFGIVISRGRILQADVLATSNEYLRRNLTLGTVGSKVYFPDAILEAGQYFVIKMLVLLPIGDSVGIAATGHIGGVHSVPVVESYRETGRPGFFAETFGGTLWVQAARVFAYPMLVISMIVFVLILTAGMKRAQGNRPDRCQKRIELFKMATSLKLDLGDEWIFDMYRERKISEILVLQGIACSDEAAKVAYKILTAGDMVQYNVPTWLGWVMTSEDAKMILTNRLISVENGNPKVNEHLREVLKSFVAYLDKQHEITRETLPIPRSKIHLYGNGKDMFVQVTQGKVVYGMRIPNGQAPIEDPRFNNYLEVAANNLEIGGKGGAAVDLPMRKGIPTGGWTPEAERIENTDGRPVGGV